MPAEQFADGRITHNTVGRINVEPGDNSVTLRLWQHALQPWAVLTRTEARLLVKKIEAALGGAPEEDFSDLA